ncbi:MAG: AAA family ATPase [Thermoflexales bacterium]|nr:AAA family ATPase [Thermoflexales bacterium]
MPHLTLSLLGPLHITRDQQPITAFAYHKARALLAYLAVEHTRVHHRDAIVGLLWPDMPDAAARTNLRQILTTLRDAIGADFLLTTRDTLQVNPASEVDLDVTRFMALLDACAQHRHRHITRCPVCAARLEEAVALYRGDFLAQFASVDSAPFEEWLVLKREALHQRAAAALTDLAHYHERWGNVPRARQLLARLIELEPWDEAAYAHLMRLSPRSAALAYYETCRRMLAEHFSVEPALATQRLYDQIRAGADTAINPPTRSLDLPIAPTPLIGRDVELAELADLLADPARRLITLVGPGGIGKTRLAIAATTANAPMFDAGAAFVNLSSLSAIELVAPAMLNALGQPIEPATEPDQQLLKYLRHREVLLVLDNFEHLLDGVDLIIRLLQQAAKVTLLITSRERLALQAEQVFELEGLSLSAAEQLFIQRAQQVQRKFQWQPQAEAIARICRLVERLPLAIELAASTVGAQACAAIADDIASSLRTLVTKYRDLPERHRSVWATFEHSWHLLSGDEQRAFQQLAVFRGGFDLDAAQSIVGMSADTLAALIDKSLLRRDSAGRFDLHELLRQYAAEKLATALDEAAATSARHSVFYGQFLHAQVDRLSSDQQAAAFAALNVEAENVRAAWRWAVDQRQWHLIRNSALDVMSWCDYQVYYTDGYHLFAEAIAHLQIGAAPIETLDMERASAEGQVLTGHGYFLWRMGHNERAQFDLQRGLDRLRRAGDTAGLADNLIGLGAVSASLGQHAAALAHFEESATLYERQADRTGYALAILQAGIVNRARGEYVAARAQLAQAIAEYRQLGDQKMVANSLSHCARLLVATDEIDLAQAAAQESLSIGRALNDRWATGGALMAQGQVAYHLGQFEVARQVLAESAREFAELTEFERRVDALNWQALSELSLGEREIARQHWLEALRLAQQGNLVCRQLDALLGLAQLNRLVGQAEIALVWMVRDHPASEALTRRRARQLLIDLDSPLVADSASMPALDDIVAHRLTG